MYALSFFSLFLPGVIMAEHTVSGKVTDASAESSVPAVNILVGRTQGKITDIDGACNMQMADPNAKFQF